MKKLALILATILVVMSFPMMLITNVSATATVTYTKGGATATTTTIADAIVNADNYTTIYLAPGSDYVLTARENWKIYNKTLTIDFGGNTVKSSGTAGNQFTGHGRVINVGFDGSTHNPTSDKAGAVTLVNGKFENAAGSPMFQLYAFMSMTFGEGCVVECHAASQYGVCILNKGAKLTFADGCHVTNTLKTPFASLDEAKSTFTDNSWYTIAGQNQVDTVLTFEEGCYVECSGALFKTGGSATSGTVNVKGGTLVTHYKNMLVTANTNFALNISGGHMYNAVLCPTNGNPVDGGYVGDAQIIYWYGEGSTLNITGSPKFYTLTEKAKYFYYDTNVLASGSIDPNTLNVTVIGEDADQVSHLEGASCRTTIGTMGLRFQSTFDKEIVDMINNVSGGTAKMGTLIAPKTYVDAAGEFTFDAFERNGLTALNVAAENGTYIDTNGDTVVKAAIVNIKEANKNLDFVATAYIEWTDLFGERHVCYSNAHPTDADARNIVEVANAALEDVKTAPEGLYTNAVVVDGVAGYARITQEQVDALLVIVK